MGRGTKLSVRLPESNAFFLLSDGTSSNFVAAETATRRKLMKARDRAAQKSRPSGGSKKPAKAASAPKRIAATKKVAPAKKPPSVTTVATKPGSPVAGAKPAQLATPVGSARPAAPAKPGTQARPAMTSGQQAAAQQAEERRKAATRKLFARIRSLEAILGADLRKRGSLLLSQAVDQWYAEATSATATDVSITNAARTVISQL